MPAIATWHEGDHLAVDLPARPERDTTIREADGIFFGADPAWSFEREYGKVRFHVSILATREVVDLEWCPTCFAGLTESRPNFYPCASCMACNQDWKIDWRLRSAPIPETDDAANAALAELLDILGGPAWLRSATVESLDNAARENVVVLKTCRKLKPAERHLIPATVRGIRVITVEPGKCTKERST